MMNRQLEQDFKVCCSINKKYGKSYYFATKFFPKEKRLATHALYAFFRLFDEIVDTQNLENNEVQYRGLQEFRLDWQKAYETGKSDHPVLRATAYVFKKYAIPYQYSESFVEAMIQDTKVGRYETYEDLKAYMYGSAAVVGLMMTHVIGFKKQETLVFAEKLGYAMQLTNFLRDIGEDYEERGRIYMPLDELAKFNITEDDIGNHDISERFVSFMKFQIDRARLLYKEADEGIPDLHRDGRFAVKMASILYGNILDEIQKQKYDVYVKRARVSTAKKLTLFLKLLFKPL
jgi:phytoene synthase